MKDMLRDRRTILAMIVLPLVLVPTIFTVMARLSFSQNKQSKLQEIRVGILTNDNGADLVSRFKFRKDLKVQEDIPVSDIKRLVEEDSLDFGLIIGEKFDQQIEEGSSGFLKLFHKSSSMDTLLYSRFMSTIRSYRKEVVRQRLKDLGTSTSILDPTDLSITNVKPGKSRFGAFAGSILSVFFILFCFLGAMYPAIDLFTGEKERGTIETLLVLPSNRFQILIGKLLVVVTSGVISGLLTFLGIFLFLKLNPNLPFISVVLNLKSVAWIILMMIPLTIFFAGLFIPITIFAKSFKEAQSLLQPMVILIFVPVVVAMMPGIELTMGTALVPILNIALACKDIVAGSIDYSLLLVVYLSLFLFAGLGIILAKHWFEKEGSIFRV